MLSIMPRGGWMRVSLPDTLQSDRLGLEGDGRQQRNTQAGPAPDSIVAVLENEAAPVRLGDLPAEDQADAGPARFRREERHEQVSGVRQSRAFVLHPQLHRRRGRAGETLPADPHAAAGFAYGIDGVSD